MTIEQAKALIPGQTLYHTIRKEIDGTPERWWVNGRVGTWKRDPYRIEIPIKRHPCENIYVRELITHDADLKYFEPA